MTSPKTSKSRSIKPSSIDTEEHPDKTAEVPPAAQITDDKPPEKTPDEEVSESESSESDDDDEVTGLTEEEEKERQREKREKVIIVEEIDEIQYSKVVLKLVMLVLGHVIYIVLHSVADKKKKR